MHQVMWVVVVLEERYSKKKVVGTEKESTRIKKDMSCCRPLDLNS